MSKIQSWLISLSSRQKTVSLCWTPSHVGVAGNERADHEARLAITQNNFENDLAISHRDYYSRIKRNVKKHWSDEREAMIDNKLRKIKDNIDAWASSYREVSLCRLRVGHTLTTHKYLTEGKHRRFCDDCLVPWTVEHFLVECPSHIEIRLRCFQSRNLDMTRVLSHGNHFPIDSVITFLSMVNLIDEI